MSQNRLKYENCAIKKAIIFSNESDLDVLRVFLVTQSKLILLLLIR